MYVTLSLILSDIQLRNRFETQCHDLQLFKKHMCYNNNSLCKFTGVDPTFNSVHTHRIKWVFNAIIQCNYFAYYRCFVHTFLSFVCQLILFSWCNLLKSNQAYFFNKRIMLLNKTLAVLFSSALRICLNMVR